MNQSLVDGWKSDVFCDFESLWALEITAKVEFVKVCFFEMREVGK